MSHHLFAIRIWLILTVVAVSLAGTPAFAQGATALRVDPSASSAQVNNRVEVQVIVDNAANLTAFELHLAFDPQVLEVLENERPNFRFLYDPELPLKEKISIVATEMYGAWKRSRAVVSP